MKDSRGFTLVELITVMAIISILSVVSVLGVSILRYGNGKSAAGRIVSALNNVRVENLTKVEQYYLVIYHEDKNYYISIQSGEGIDRKEIKKEKLDLRNGEIRCQTNKESYLISSISVDDEITREELELSFIKDTGGLKKDSMDEQVEFITVKAGHRSYDIYLVEATGKVYIK